MENEINNAKDVLLQSEANRMKLVNAINQKRAEAKLSFDGKEVTAQFISDYNNLVDEHNRIAVMQNSIRDNIKDYISITGTNQIDKILMNATGLFAKAKERREIKQETKAKILEEGGSKKDARKGARQELMDRGKNSKLVQKFKTANLAPLRLPCLAMIRINLWGLASSMLKWKTSSPEKYTSVRNQWYRMGGNRTDFDNAIIKGGKLKPIRLFMKKDLIKAKFEGEEKLGIATEAVIVASITAGGSVLASLVNSFKKAGGVPDAPEGSAMPEISAKEQQLLDDVAEAVDSGAVNPDADYTLLWVGLGILAVAGVIFTIVMINKKKSKKQ